MNIFGTPGTSGSSSEGTADFGGTEIVGQDATLGTSNDVPMWLISGGNKRIRLNNEEPVTILDQGVGGIGLNATKVTLAQDPTDALEAATKQYVDAQAAGNIFDQPLNSTDNVTFNRVAAPIDTGEVRFSGQLEIKDTSTVPYMTIVEGTDVETNVGLRCKEVVNCEKDVNVGGNITVTGNVTVNGTTTTLNTQNLEVQDKQVLLNDGEPGAGVSNGFGQAGILIDRGTENNVEMVFDDADNDTWKFRDAVTSSVLPISAGDSSFTTVDTTELKSTNTVNGTAISNAQWGYLGSMDQSLATTDDVKFNSVDTVELKNTNTINGTAISNTQWGYLGAQDQGVGTGDTVGFAQINSQIMNIIPVAYLPSGVDPTVTLPQDRHLVIKNGGTGSGDIYVDMPAYPSGTHCKVTTEHSNNIWPKVYLRAAPGVTLTEIFRDGQFKKYTDTNGVYYTLRRFNCVKIQYHESGRITLVDCMRQGDITNAQWNYLESADQATATTDDVKFASVDTVELKNTNTVNGATITNAQWGHVGAMDQDVATTSNVTFASVSADTRMDTKELYMGDGTLNRIEMVGANNEIEFANNLVIQDNTLTPRVTINGSTDVTVQPPLKCTNGITSFGSFNAQGTGFVIDPVTQTQIKGRVISTTQWDYLSTQNQPVDTAANVTFADVNATGVLTAAVARLQSHTNVTVVLPPPADGAAITGTVGGTEFELVYSAGNTAVGSINPYIGIGPESNLPDFQLSVIKIATATTPVPNVSSFSDLYYSPSTIAYVGVGTKTFDAEYRFTVINSNAGEGRFVVKVNKQDGNGPQEIPNSVVEQTLLNGVATLFNSRFKLYSLQPTWRISFHFRTAANESFILRDVYFSFTQLLI